MWFKCILPVTVYWETALVQNTCHYNDVIMGAMASQITSLPIVYSTVYSGADQRKHQNSASLTFVWGIQRWPVNSPHKWPMTRKMVPFDDVIMLYIYTYILIITVKPIQHLAFGYPDSSYCQAIGNLVIYCVMFFRCGVNIIWNCNYAQGTTFIFDWRMKNNGKFWERRCITQGVMSHPRGDLNHISIDSCQTALIIWDARTRHPIFSVLEYSL